jgi:hypothetical protein
LRRLHGSGGTLPAGYATKPCTGVIHDATPNLEANAESFGNRPFATGITGWCMRAAGSWSRPMTDRYLRSLRSWTYISSSRAALASKRLRDGSWPRSGQRRRAETHRRRAINKSFPGRRVGAPSGKFSRKRIDPAGSLRWLRHLSCDWCQIPRTFPSGP